VAVLTLKNGGRRGTRITLATAVVVFAATTLLPMGSDLRARIALTGIGVMLAVLVIARPEGVWETGTAQVYRWFLGDWGVLIICLALAVAIIRIAWVTRF
jgi:hypothetical protein